MVPPSVLIGQTRWFKYEGNPILETGGGDAWDNQYAIIGRVLLKDSVYRMWYAGNRDDVNSSIGYATSKDGFHWKKHSSNPVLSVTQPWEQDRVFWPYVSYARSEYKLWYSARGGGRIGYATSKDGVVWTKHLGNPVLSTGPASWDSGAVGWASVIGPDSSGGYKMWFEGANSGWRRSQIGFATASDETTWTKFDGNPVFTYGEPGSWEDVRLRIPRVLFNGELYEMWYGAGPNLIPRSVGYANSTDGIHWTRYAGNPVIQPGPETSWDGKGVAPGDVYFDGQNYFMWYTGHNGSKMQGGLAVSPKGITTMVEPSKEQLAPLRGSVRLAIKVDDPTGMVFSARIRSRHWRETNASATTPLEGLREVAFLRLFDDGLHEDNLPGDGFFANSWIPTEENIYFADFLLTLERKKDVPFEMRNAGIFTSMGPLGLDSLILVGNQKPVPGDTVVVKLVLRNLGHAGEFDAVSASVLPPEHWITVTEVSPTYGRIFPGGTAATRGYYQLYIHPDSPIDADVRLSVSIAEMNVSLWRDSFDLHIFPPWWRTDWAYGLYGVLALAVLDGLRRYEIKRTRLKHQRELEQVEAEKLRELDKMKSHFFANISHEFRTPLTLLLGPIEKWREKAQGEDLQKDLGMMQRNARRLLRLINQLLDISKLEAGSMKLRATRGNIVTFAKGIAQSFQSVAANKNIMLRIESASEEIELYFDRDKMEKILSNLLSNAFKFTAEGGEVSLSLRRNPLSNQIDSSLKNAPRNDMLKLIVTDTGIGIPEEELQHIFDRFYQVDGSHTRDQEGTGIGLALVKELVEVHHGTISVRSEIGKGTEFTIQIPLGLAHLRDEEILQQPIETVKQVKVTELEASAVSEDTLGQTDEERKHAENESITLVVEDNSDVRSYMREYLDPAYKVLEARDGNEGVKIAIDTIPDLIISDVMMPKMDGYELCRILKLDEKTSHIPIILLTAKAGTESKIKGLETGADDYLVKPFDGKELLARVRNLIELRRRLREKFEKTKVLKPGEIAVKSMDDVFLKKAMDVVERHMGDEKFSIEQFSGEMNMSRVQLHRKITALTNHSARDFVRYLRLHRGMDLLKRNAGTIAEVAYTVGFASPAYFTKCFHEQFGYPPNEVRRHEVTQKRS